MRNGDGAYSEEAHQVVYNLSKLIIQQIERYRKPGGLLIALHNNTNGNYSITSYESGSLKSDAADLHRAAGQDSDNFFFVTTKKLFLRFKNAGFNVVLQARSVKDDGSLSVWAARKNFAYVNIEAQHGHVSSQLKMLSYVR